MRTLPINRRLGAVFFGVMAMVAAAFAAISPARASAVVTDNVCINSITSDLSDLPVDVTATPPAAPVASGDSVVLADIEQAVQVPSNIFLTGYRLGLLGEPGVKNIPAKVRTQIAATSTAEGAQGTNEVDSNITTEITDPTPADKNSGDEAATPGELPASYDDQNWTAGGPTADAGPDQQVNGGANVALDGSGSAGFPGGPLNFREQTLTGLDSANPGVGGVVIRAVIGGALPINFACSPGQADNGSPLFDDPAAPFATGPTVSAGGPITGYAWTQTAGPTVALSGADTATPSFTAPGQAANLEFELEVNDGTSTATDTVAVDVGKSQACEKAEKKFKKAKKSFKKAKKNFKKAKKSVKKSKTKKAKKELKRAKKQLKNAKKRLKKAKKQLKDCV